MKYFLMGLFFSINVFAIDSNTKEQLNNVFKSYESLHASFFSFDKKKVIDGSKELAEKISSIEDEEVSKLLAYSKKTLNKMSKEEDRSELNNQLNRISMALIHIMKKYSLDLDYSSYYCPMVKKKWIQNSKKVSEVQNPYAPEMPNCGAKE
ncbi:MAG: hypothetical protein OEY33_08660 [Bdellovibrionales bacterium]|jgi:hypothetical protein|nr:hypothetical protein [Bdellovibrionales bacterium]